MKVRGSCRFDCGRPSVKPSDVLLRSVQAREVQQSVAVVIRVLSDGLVYIRVLLRVYRASIAITNCY